MTQSETLRQVHRDAPLKTFEALTTLVNLLNGKHGAPAQLVGYDSATTANLRVQNQNSAANAPSGLFDDDAAAKLLHILKSGVSAGKLLTGESGGVFYPTLQVKDAAAGVLNLDVATGGVITRPLWKNWNGTTVYAQSNATEMLINPQARVTNGTVDYLKANATEVLTLTQLRNWNGTIDYLKSTSTELLARPKLRVWDGTNAFLTVDSAEALIRTKARVWDGTNAFLTSDSTEMLVNPQLRVWNLTTDFLKANATETLINPLFRVWNGTTTLLTADATLQKVGVGTVGTVAPVSTDALMQVDGFFRITNNAGAPTVGGGLEMQYLPGSTLGVIKSRDIGSGVYGMLVVDGNPVHLRYQTTSRIEIGATGIGFFAVGQVAQQAAPAQVTGTADSTYGDTERDVINALVAAVNAHTDALEAYGLEA